MAGAMAVQVTMYLNEADQWHHRPLHLEVLNYLRKESVYAAIAVHAVAGFLGRHKVESWTWWMRAANFPSSSSSWTPMST